MLIKRKKVLPLCVALAKFKSGPLRERINVSGVTNPFILNKNGLCKYYRPKIFYSQYIRDIKNWIKESINAQDADIKEISFEEEDKESAKFKANTRGSRKKYSKEKKSSTDKQDTYKESNSKGGSDSGSESGSSDDLRNEPGSYVDEAPKDTSFEKEGDETD